MSPGTQMASPSRGTELERSEQILWDDVCVPGVWQQIGSCSRRGRTCGGLGKFNIDILMGQTLLHLCKITENKDGKKLTIR